jgi:formylglycine-generating enzyme required for sulfatase activity
MGTAADEQLPPFCMDEFEFPNVAHGLPRVAVRWAEAKEACEQAGKRLCTEAEWEKACKGPGDRTQKGGASDRPDYAARCSARENGAPTGSAPTVGFRCCSDVRP